MKGFLWSVSLTGLVPVTASHFSGLSRFLIFCWCFLPQGLCLCHSVCLGHVSLPLSFSSLVGSHLFSLGPSSFRVSYCQAPSSSPSEPSGPSSLWNPVPFLSLLYSYPISLWTMGLLEGWDRICFNSSSWSWYAAHSRGSLRVC